MSRTQAATDAFTAIAEPRRRQIIDLLARRRMMDVSAIVLAVGLRQPSVSKHLGVLREAGLVNVRKQGQQRVYELNLNSLRPVYDWLRTFEQHWDHQLDRIKQRAERKALLAARNAALKNEAAVKGERVARIPSSRKKGNS